MRAFWAVVFRDMAERRMVWFAAVLGGFFPLAMETFWTPGRFEPGELRDATAFTLTILTAVGLSMAYGASMVSAELSERRLSFYLARPVGFAALWWGKVVAALATVLGVILCVSLPTIFFGGRPWDFLVPTLDLRFLPHTHAWAPDWVWPWFHMRHSSHLPAEVPWLMALGVWSFGSLGILVLTHGVATGWRSRGRWLLLDLAMVGVFTVLYSAFFNRLNDLAAFERLRWVFVTLLVALVLAALVAGHVQLKRGRVSVQRSHGAFSLCFWPVLAIVAAAHLLLTVSTDRVDPGDIESLAAMRSAPVGEWATLVGEPRGRTLPWIPRDYLPTFIVDPSTGEFHDLGSALFLADAPLFSADGDTVVWLACREGRWIQCEVGWRHLRPGPGPESGQLTVRPLRRSYFEGYPKRGASFAVDPNGEFVAMLDQDQQLTVHRLSDQALVHSERVTDSAHQMSLEFIDGEHLRIFLASTPTHRVEIWELEVGQGRAQRLTEVPGVGYYLAPDTRSMIVWHRESWSLFDVMGQRELYSRSGNLPKIHQAQILSGNWVALATHLGEHGTELTLISPSGEEVHRLPRKPDRHLQLGGEIHPGQWLLGWYGFDDEYRSDWETWLVDVDSGEILETWSGWIPNGQSGGPGLPGAQWLFDPLQRIQRLSVVDGTVQGQLPEPFLPSSWRRGS